MTPPDRLTPELLAEIEAYYDGELSTEAADHLRGRLNEDESLARAVAEWEAVYRYGLAGGIPESSDALRAQFNRYEEEMANAPVVRKLQPRRHWLAIAAVGLLLLVAGWWLLDRPNPAARLAQDNFVFFKQQDKLLGKEDAAKDAQAGLDAYDRQNYAEAYPRIRDGVASGLLDSIKLIYAGVAALGAGEPDVARDLLRPLLRSPIYSDYEGELRYYLALAELQLGNVAAAEEQLTVDLPVDRNIEAPRQNLIKGIETLRSPR